MAELSRKGRRLIDIAMANDEPPSVDDSWGTLVSRLTMEAPRGAAPSEPTGARGRVLVVVVAVAAFVVTGGAWWWSQWRVPAVEREVEAPTASPPIERPRRAADTKGSATGLAVRELLPAAEAALAADDPDRAMALLQEHAARAPTDHAAPHRMALRVLVLCAKGERAQARDEASAFLVAHHDSQWSDAVRASCAAR